MEPKEHSIQEAAAKLQVEPSPEAPPTEEPEAPAEPEAETETEMSDDQTSETEVEEEEEYVPTDSSVSEGEEVEPEEVESEAGGEEQLDYYLIKVDGEEVEVTLDELRSGYQRQKDYTKKTQTLADQRKDYESKTGELGKLQESFLHQATLANELLNRDLKKYESVDWETLKIEDPVAFVTKQLEVQEIRNNQQGLQAQAQQSYELQQKMQAEESQKYLESQRKEALSLFPDWKTSDKADAHQLKIINYAKNLGYADQELANIINAKDLLVLDKARQFDELQGKKKGISSKQKAPAIRKRVKSKGLAPKGVNKAKSVKTRQDNLRKSGSIKDAAALMMEMRESTTVVKPRG
jgi:hypothetical protein